MDELGANKQAKTLLTTAALAAATRTIDLLLPLAGSDTIPISFIEVLRDTVRRGVRVRVVLPILSFEPITTRDVTTQAKGLADSLVVLGVDVRFALQQSTIAPTIVLDERRLLHSPGSDVTSPLWATTDRAQLANAIAKFDDLWSFSLPFFAVQEVFRDAQLRFGLPVHRVITTSSDVWDDLISKLSRAPALLHELNPRKFEELVAELLDREGAEVTLTPQSKDGGRDVLAFYNTPMGHHLYLVECKHYAPKHKVDVSIVRALFGVVQQERATAGLVVTTSSFTRGAINFQNKVQYQLDLRDYQGLVSWLQRRTK